VTLATVNTNKNTQTMPKYKKKSIKKTLYNKLKSSNTKKSCLRGSSQVGIIINASREDSNICSQCQASGRGLIQCECCDLWYCNVCCEISDEAFTLLSEAECLHFFCSSCGGKVFNLINKKSPDVSATAGTQSDLLSAVTDTISIATNNIQTAMQATITSLLDRSEIQEQSMTVDDQPICASSLCHSEISQAISSVLNEEKVKENLTSFYIIYQNPMLRMSQYVGSMMKTLLRLSSTNI